MADKIERKLKTFYTWFGKSRLYYGIMVLIIFAGVLFYPASPAFSLFNYGHFIAGPIIALMLMLVVFILYRNIFLYLAVILYTVVSILLTFIGAAMGVRTWWDLIAFFLPIIIVIIINICIAIWTYKYKK